MTRENVKKNMDIISAFAEGKVIQMLNERCEWVDLTEKEGLPMGTLEEEPNIFRIKLEPSYRPFKNAEECWTEMQKHQPFGWVVDRKSGVMYLLRSLTGTSVYTSIQYLFRDAFDKLVFADLVPFGVKEEEQLWLNFVLCLP